MGKGFSVSLFHCDFLKDLIDLCESQTRGGQSQKGTNSRCMFGLLCIKEMKKESSITIRTFVI